MSAIEKYDGGLAASIETFGGLAGQIAQTDFVPDAFKRNPAAVLACMLFGQECGLGPMASLNLTQSIKGKVGLKPEGMRAVVQSHGHRIWPEEYTDTAVTLCGWRKGDPEDVVVRVRWTMDDAKRAKLGGESWAKYPRAMLMARATAELCRVHFADCTGGLAYGGDELEEMAPARPVAAVAAAEPFPDAKPAPARRGPRKPPTRPANVTDDGEVVEAEVVDDAFPLVPQPMLDRLWDKVKEWDDSYKQSFRTEKDGLGLPSMADASLWSTEQYEQVLALVHRFEDSIAAAEAPFTDEPPTLGEAS